ncbi:MAG TPA: hypothetical protein VIM41_06670, partial [Gammaproteobacteria bacterium]
SRSSKRMAALQLLGMERPFRIPFHRAQRLALHSENRTLHRVQLRILGLRNPDGKITKIEK